MDKINSVQNNLSKNRHARINKKVNNVKNNVFKIIIQATVRDEEHILTEWILYHLLLWVEHIYIYDDLSKNPVSKYIERLPQHFREKITVYRIDKELFREEELRDSIYFDAEIFEKFWFNKQRYLLNHFLKNHKNLSEWCLFCDADEFLYLNTADSIVEILNQYDDFDTIYIPWLNHWSSFHINMPDGLIIENFKYHDSLYHYRWKSIAKTWKIDEIFSPHIVWPNVFEFDFNVPLYQLPMHINHYRICDIKTFISRKIRWEIGYRKGASRSWNEIVRLMFSYNEKLSSMVFENSKKITEILWTSNFDHKLDDTKVNIFQCWNMLIHEWNEYSDEALSNVIEMSWRFLSLYELLPEDFSIDWYMRLNPDLNDLNELDIIRHYLIWSKKEKRLYKVTWINYEEYLDKYPELSKLESTAEKESHVISKNPIHKFKRELPLDFNVKVFKELHVELINASDVEARNFYRTSTQSLVYNFNVPKDFDMHLYRKANPEMAHLSDIKIKLHYLLNKQIWKRN